MVSVLDSEMADPGGEGVCVLLVVVAEMRARGFWLLTRRGLQRVRVGDGGAGGRLG